MHFRGRHVFKAKLYKHPRLCNECMLPCRDKVVIVKSEKRDAGSVGQQCVEGDGSGKSSEGSKISEGGNEEEVGKSSEGGKEEGGGKSSEGGKEEEGSEEHTVREGWHQGSRVLLMRGKAHRRSSLHVLGMFRQTHQACEAPPMNTVNLAERQRLATKVNVDAVRERAKLRLRFRVFKSRSLKLIFWLLFVAYPTVSRKV